MNYTRHFECGCKVVVIGELTNAEIRYCPLHKQAPRLYEALGTIKRTAEDAGGGYDAKMVLKTIYRIAKEVTAEVEKK